MKVKLFCISERAACI